MAEYIDSLQCPFCTVKIEEVVPECYVVAHEDTYHPEWLWELIGEMAEAT